MAAHGVRSVDPPTRPRRHRPRIIPVLLVRDGLLYKTARFSRPKYVGDPRIAVKIFNDKFADEIVVLDVGATPAGSGPNFALIRDLAGEAFMPMAYGGGVRTYADAAELFNLGVEKVLVNTAAHETPALVSTLAREFGSQSIVASIDVKRTWTGAARVYTHCGMRKTRLAPVECARRMQAAGAGEILLTSIDRDGTFQGYDIMLTWEVSAAVTIPVVACGGAGRIEDCVRVVREGGASAAAAGSIFVFQGPHRAVLITFPTDRSLRAAFGD